MFSLKKQIVHKREYCKIILTSDTKAKLLNFTEKLKTASGKCWTCVGQTLSHGHLVPFGVNVILNLSISP